MGNLIKHHWNTTVTGGLITAVLNEPISENDENANEFSVTVQNANFESATCKGFFIRGDGTTIILDGEVSGNTASVVLAPNCYNVTGRFTITVKVTKGESKTSWLRVEGYVKATSTDDYALAGDDSAPIDMILAAAAEAEEILASIPEDYTTLSERAVENTEKIGQLSEEMEDNNCVNYLGRLPDIAETTKNGITYSCTDGVWRFSGTATDTVFVRLYDGAVPDWWIPGKKILLVYEKTDGSSLSPSLRIYKNGSTELTRSDGLSGVKEYTIPDDDEITGLQIRLHIAAGGVADATITQAEIRNSLSNVELAQKISAAVDALNNEISGLSTNLPIEWEDGYYIRGETGGVVENTSLSASAPIDIAAYAGMAVKIVCRIANTQGFAFYTGQPCNASTYISGENGDTSGLSGSASEYDTVIPENAAYLRITAMTSSKEPCLVRPLPTLNDIAEKAEKSNGASRVFERNIAMFGDSITLGRDGNDVPGNMVITANTIPATVEKMLGVNTVNYGVGSMGWLAKGGSMNAYEKLASVDLTAYDTVTLCFGVNDHHETLGTWDSTDEETVMGQFHKCINYIYDQNPSCRVIVIGPFNGRNVGTFPDYWYGSDNWGPLNTMLKQACDYYWLPYIDQHDGPINAFTIQTLIGEDGVHPSEEGYQRLGEWIAGEMQRLIG